MVLLGREFLRDRGAEWEKVRDGDTWVGGGSVLMKYAGCCQSVADLSFDCVFLCSHASARLKRNVYSIITLGLWVRNMPQLCRNTPVVFVNPVLMLPFLMAAQTFSPSRLNRWPFCVIDIVVSMGIGFKHQELV